MSKQFFPLLLLFMCLLTLHAEDSVQVNLRVYPDDLTIKIDGNPIMEHGKDRRLSLLPGKYSLSAESKDSVLTERKITIHERDLFNTILYRINGRKSKRRFRIQLGGQWMFNEYEESPFYLVGKKTTGEEVISTPVYSKPITFATLDLGFINKNDFFFGIYGELFNAGGMFSFGKEIQLHPAIKLYLGGKAGFMMEQHNNYYLEYVSDGDTLFSFPTQWLMSGYYEYNGWINGKVEDSSKFVEDAYNENELMRFASLDAQISLGKRAIKFYLKSSLWLGRVTDYDSYTYVRHDPYDYDTTFAVDFDFKVVPLPSFSAGVQFDIARKSKIGIHGPYGSNRVHSSKSHKNDILGGTKLSQKGSRWFGGSFKINNERDTRYHYPNNNNNSNSDYTTTVLKRTFTLSTITRFYPRDNFILGPSFKWSLISDRSGYSVERSQILLLGADIGYSRNVRKKVIYYGLVNPQLALGIHNGGDWGDERMVYPDYFLTVKLGAIYMFNKQIGLQVEPSFPILPYVYDGFTWDLFFGFTFSLDRNFFSMGTSLFDR